MNKVNFKINLWGRDFDLNGVMQCYPGEEPTQTQKDAWNKFISNSNISDDTKNAVEEYVLKHGLSDTGATDVDNIFKYVIPKSIIIPRSKRLAVAIMCNFKFDPEQGIAILFEDGKLKEVGPQDIAL